MLVYHGTGTSNLNRFISADGNVDFTAYRWLGIGVTDSEAHASRYANAQCTGVVRKEYSPLANSAAIVVIEIDNPDFHWFNRSEDHNSLDVCEQYIKAGKVVKVIAHECDYVPCTCHAEVQGFRAAMPMVEVVNA